MVSTSGKVIRLLLKSSLLLVFLVTYLTFLQFAYAGTYPYTKQPIAREMILEIAHLYHAVNWRCDPENAYGTSIPGASCPYGTVSGWKDNYPYCWGGDDEFYEFLEKMTEGKGAGDMDTSDYLPYYNGLVAGCDCSGYASQCFRAGRYSTSTFPGITTEVGWENLAPGDALNKPGFHIRIVEKYFSDTDQVLVYESTGAGWKVQHRVLPRDDTYQAVRYDYTVDMPSILSVLQSGNGEVTITWLGQAETGFRIYQSTDASSWSIVLDENDLDADADSAVISGLNANKAYYFKVVAVNGSTESGPSSVYPARLPESGDAPVLIVDGFDRWIRKSPSTQFNDFLVRYGKPLDYYGANFETTNNFRITRDEIDLSSYSAIIWMCGDESTAEYSLNYLEMIALRSYLENGGMLFITGSEIGWDLVEREVPFDNLDVYESDFFSTYLKAQYAGDDAGTYAVGGLPGTIFEGLSLVFDDGTLGTYDVGYPDEVNASGGSAVNLAYAGAGNAGIQYSGLFGSGSTEGKVVFLGFPYETISPETARFDVMSAVLDYFEIPPALPSHVVLRSGNVNAGVGSIEDVFYINESPGDVQRRIKVTQGTMLSGTMQRPSSGPNPAKYTLYVWPWEANSGDPAEQPYDVGLSCFPFPSSNGTTTPPPYTIVNNIGHRWLLGYPYFPSTAAGDTPVTVFQYSLLAPGSYTFQGLIMDDGATSPQVNVSITNAIVVDVVP